MSTIPRPIMLIPHDSFCRDCGTLFDQRIGHRCPGKRIQAIEAEKARAIAAHYLRSVGRPA